jgi:CheY-like chemotaxis protein
MSRVHSESLSTEPGVVLVVEDEAAVRLFCCTVLRRSGYRVLEAAGPIEALDALQQAPVGLVLTDITMPGMNGKEMVKRIDRKQQPDLKVLYMSGYSENFEPGLDLLEKPFTSADLLKRVHAAFDAHKSG